MIDPKSITVGFSYGENDQVSLYAPRRGFKSGSSGYFAGGKIEIEGKKYQVSCSVVEIGSKPVVE